MRRSHSHPTSARSLVFATVLVACGGDDAATGEATGTTTTDASTSTGDAPPTTSSADTSTGEPASWCAGPTALQYDPLALRLDAFPDDVFTVDADTATGVRVDLRPGENVTLDGASMPFGPLFEDASTLDGFGTTGGAYFRVSAALLEASLPAVANDAPTPDDGLLLLDLDADPVALVPLGWKQIAEEAGASEVTLLVEPMIPLRPAHRHALVLTTAVEADGGGCVAPSPTLVSMLDGSATDPALARMIPRLGELVDVLVGLGAIEAATDLSAAVVFTTQHTVEDSATIAAEIRAAAPPAFTPVGECADDPEALWIKCSGTLDVLDYTDQDEAVAADLTAQGGYALPVRIWLPREGTAPYPVFVYGHGLAGDKDQADALADFVAPIGAAVVAVDAPKHGQHPDAGAIDVLDFFGLSLDLADPLNAFALRDNFRQGTFDRLQLVSALVGGIDADGDDVVDLDSDRLHYLGVSLGGIMGAELLAFAPEFDTATLMVPGARVGSIVAEGEQFSVVVDVFASMASDGEIARFFPLLQTAIDRGDAGAYVRHIAQERLPGFDEATPQVLVQMVLDDDTVPNSTNLFYARGVGAPLVGDELLPVGWVAHEPELPTAGNKDATHTWGLFQYDVLDARGSVAEHSNLGRSLVAQTQITQFVTTNLAGEVAEIVDPYRELEIK